MNEATLFTTALEIRSPAERSAYLDEACRGDAPLRRRIDELLEAHAESSGFLESSVSSATETQAAPAWPKLEPRPLERDTEGAGAMIGRYKLLQQIGEGGFGAVWMAEQRQPVKRKVALKIIKLGMDTRQVIARFEAERQALAMMDHPNIAKVLDAGATDSGRPYFVMELVKGVPITEYCDGNNLSPTHRLDLFVKVCQAIQHAHQKGIIHRDIKPSNILVTLHDGTPVPKVIDFGIAKATNAELTEKTLFTEHRQMIGTPAYMSPEQAEMSGLDIDTRSDIYSLGVLLYELLTGTTPFDAADLRKAGLAEIQRIIREEEPPRPSTRVSTMENLALTAIAKSRATEARKLSMVIRGDLDWIVMKSLEKDRTRRYETANGLAADIQRHLQSEPVAARPPGGFYRLQKLVHRNKLAFAAVGCVMLALVIGLVGSLWQAGRAQREAARASAALNDLRAAAPAIAAQAKALAAREQFDEAIDKLNYATQLRPDLPEYILAKADLLESQRQLLLAAGVYRAALKLSPNDLRAKANAELCEQLAAAPVGPDGKPTRESLSRLYAQMVKDQRHTAELMPVARALGEEKKLIIDYWLGRLKGLPIASDNPLEKRLSVREDGTLELNLKGTEISDLSPLAGMPLGTLDLSDCRKVTELSSLRGMSLSSLDAENTSVSSLEPLREMASLQTLVLMNTKVTDLSPLQGLRLKWLNVAGCTVGSIAPLRGMPLETLNLRSTVISDLAPLSGMPLKSIDLTAIPAQDFSPLAGLPLERCSLTNTRVGDLAFLKGAPLKELVVWECTQLRGLRVLSELKKLEVLWLPVNFINLPQEEIAAVEALRNHPSLKQISAKPIPSMQVEKAPSCEAFWGSWEKDQAWALRLRKARIIFRRRVCDDGTWWFACQNSRALKDFSILNGAAISQLNAQGCAVTDLAPLSTLPLISLDLNNTSVADLTPIHGLKLESIWLYGTQVRDLTPLKGMPLTFLDLRKCEQLIDVSPLVDIPSIERVALPMRARNVDALRKLPKLREIAISWIANKGPICTIEEFWKSWDGLPWARRLETDGIAYDAEQLPGGFFAVTVRDPKFSDCSIFKGSNIRQLTLDDSSVTDLSPLSQVPLELLSIHRTPVTDLAALRSPLLRDALRTFRASRIAVTDFSPLGGCVNLETVDVGSTSLRDLQVFQGIKLRDLKTPSAPVSDISVLAGMPLEQVQLHNTLIIDISPLLRCPTLKSITLPRNARNVEALRELRNLEWLSYNYITGPGTPDLSAADFWNAINKDEPWIAAVRNADLDAKPRRLPDGSWELNFEGQPIADLSILKGGSITRLSLSHTPITDLSPLRGMKLTNLKLSGTDVTDLRPLEGMPITSMTISGTNVRDLTPLIGMPLKTLNMTDCKSITDVSTLTGMSGTLENVILPPGATTFEFLRQFPKLKRLGFRFDTTLRGPSQTAAEFWAEYDRKGEAATNGTTTKPTAD